MTANDTWRQPPPGMVLLKEGVVKQGDWFYIDLLGAWGSVPKSGWGEQITGALVARGTAANALGLILKYC